MLSPDLINSHYQLPLILTALLHADLINRVIMTLLFLNDVVNDIESSLNRHGKQ